MSEQHQTIASFPAQVFQYEQLPSRPDDFSQRIVPEELPKHDNIVYDTTVTSSGRELCKFYL